MTGFSAYLATSALLAFGFPQRQELRIVKCEPIDYTPNIPATINLVQYR
jgi:hypothetical protein